MATLKQIQGIGIEYGDLKLESKNPRGGRNQDIGLQVDVPAGQRVFIPSVRVARCFVNLIKTGSGELHIGYFESREFGGDNYNIRGSNVTIEETVVRDNTPTRPYGLCVREGDESVAECLARHGEEVYDPYFLDFEPCPEVEQYRELWGKDVILGYHVDGVAQIFAPKPGSIWKPDPNGVIENINLPSIDAEISGKKSQAIIGSEECQYDGMNIGTKKFRVKLEGADTSESEFHTIFNSAVNSTFGCEGCEVDGKLKIKNVKHSRWTSSDNVIIGIPEPDIVCDAGAICKHEDDAMSSAGQQEVKPSTSHESGGFTIIPNHSLEEYSLQMDVEPAALEAIIQKESKGKAHYKGRISKLFECHIYDASLRSYGVDPADVIAEIPAAQDLIGYRPYKNYGNYRKQQTRFDKAFAIHEESAIEACSWGFAQVLGKNWKMCGLKSPHDFRNAVQTKEGQLYVFVQYIRNCDGLIEALQDKDWYRVKKLYNGPRDSDENNDGIDDYTADLVKEYTRAVLRRNPRKGSKKSHTQWSNAISAATKLTAAGALGISAEQLTALIGTVSSSADKISDAANAGKEILRDASDTLQKTTETISVVGDTLIFPSDQPQWWLPWAFGAVLIVTLPANIHIFRRYRLDHGYTKGKSDVI